LINNHINDYDTKINEKDKQIEQISYKNMLMESEVKNLNENCKQYEMSITAFKEKETELNSEVKALNEKLNLLKNVNENSQFGHSQIIQQMKTE